uniref:Interleukin 17 receptor n=1 Tax=Lysmata vittata TaxID=749979 RepID=A0A977XCY2_9EUCA|nr:interleukin 17 receptor [Lysmata vittata]
MHPGFLWLWILIHPVMSTDPCLVTEIETRPNHTHVSVHYTAVYDREKCPDKEPKCPGSKPDLLRQNAKLVANGQEDKALRKFRLQDAGDICYMRNIKAVIICGNVSSSAIQMPVLDPPAFLKKILNDSILVIRIEPHKQAENFYVRVNERDSGNLIADKTNVLPATDVILHGNFSSPHRLLIRLKPKLRMKDLHCESYFFSRILGEYTEKDKDSLSGEEEKDSGTDWRWMILIGAALCIILLVGVLWRISAIFRRRNNKERKAYIEYPKRDDIALKSVLIIHTLESAELSQEVEGLVHSLQNTCIEKVYDIFDIKEDKVLSNAEPWLINLLCLEEQTAVIIVCTPGLMKMIKAVKKQESDTAAVDILGRQHQPFDWLLLNFLRLLCRSEYDNYYERFFAVSFENVGDSSLDKEWHTEMRTAGFPDIGWSRLYCLPSHLNQLKDVLLQRDVTSYSSNKESDSFLRRDST